MKEESRKLRIEGLTFSEISKKMSVNVRQIRSWVSDIKLSRDQIADKIRRIKLIEAENRYRKVVVDKERLQSTLLNNGFYKTIRIMGLTEGCFRYWCNEYNITLENTKKKRKEHLECCICHKQYSGLQDKRNICNTCVSKLRRRANKIKAINRLGGKCKSCGYEINEDNYAAFEFHHSENNKELEIGSVLNRKWEIIEKELKKCDLLCSNCHRIMHSDYKNTRVIDNAKIEYVKDRDANKIKLLMREGEAATDVYKNDVENKDVKPIITIRDEDLRVMVQSQSLVKIANKFNVPVGVVAKICKNKNIIIPHKSFLTKKFDITEEEMVNLLKTKPVAQIGEMFGVSDNAIRHRCKAMGVNWKEVSSFSHLSCGIKN